MHPRNDPAKSIFFPRNACPPACLSMLHDKTFFFLDKKMTLPLTGSTTRRLCLEFSLAAQHVAEGSRLPVEVLPLDLVQEVEVALVEVVHTDVTVFSSGRVALASRVRSDGILIPRVSI
jgi:hypothetical protein